MRRATAGVGQADWAMGDLPETITRARPWPYIGQTSALVAYLDDPARPRFSVESGLPSAGAFSAVGPRSAVGTFARGLREVK